MKLFTAIVISCALPLVASSALADIAPPQIHFSGPERPATPGALDNAANIFARAIATSKPKLAQEWVDARGWAENLVGPSGAKVSDFVAALVSAKRTLTFNWWGAFQYTTGKTKAGQAWLVPARLSRVGDKASELVFVLFVEKEGSYSVLGVGKKDEVRALARRHQNAVSLAPETKKPSVD